MPPISDKTIVSFKMGAIIASLVFVVSSTWKVAGFMSSFELFKNNTENHFTAIETTLSGNRNIIESQGKIIALIQGRQDVVIGDRWTETNQKDWAYQLDKSNREADGGKGIKVPDVGDIADKKPLNMRSFPTFDLNSLPNKH